MPDLVADFLLARLREWGVHRVFGYPGDGINAIIGAFDRADGDPELIQVRHEEMAAFMACAHAKFTGEVGVCLATSGPGAIHLLNGLYDAKLDHQPVVAIVGQQARAALGGNYQQEVDLAVALQGRRPRVRPHCVDGRADAPPRRPRRPHRRRPAHRHLPDRPQRPRLRAGGRSPPHEHGTVHSAVGYSRPAIVPAEADLDRAAAVLNEGSRVAMLVGQGALHAADEVREVADLLGAGVAKALLGKAALPDDLPYVTGSIGLLGTKPSWDLMDGCDTLLMVGSSFPYSEFLPEEGAARGVQIDIDGRMIGIRYPMEVNLVGDSKATLRAADPAPRAQGRRRMAGGDREQRRGSGGA